MSLFPSSIDSDYLPTLETSMPKVSKKERERQQHSAAQKRDRDAINGKLEELRCEAFDVVEQLFKLLGKSRKEDDIEAMGKPPSKEPTARAAEKKLARRMLNALNRVNKLSGEGLDIELKDAFFKELDLLTANIISPGSSYRAEPNSEHKCIVDHLLKAGMKYSIERVTRKSYS